VALCLLVVAAALYGRLAVAAEPAAAASEQKAKPEAVPANIPQARLVILVVIDSLTADAPEQADLPALEQLAKRGCRYRQVHLPLPGPKPKDKAYPWACTPHTPVLVTGTPLLGIEGIRKAMIQHQFDPKQTAYFANTKNFNDTAGDFGTALAQNHTPPSRVIDRAVNKLEGDPGIRYLRLHLRHTNKYGVIVGARHRADEPWHGDIWHKDSPYRHACEKDDKELGRLVKWLEDSGRLKETVLLVCGKQGMGVKGGKDPLAPGAAATTLVIAGAGVAGGRTFEQCEIYDVAPTVAAVAGHRPPMFTIGRVLVEAFNVKVAPPNQVDLTQRLNATLLKFEKLPKARQKALTEAGFHRLGDIGRWHLAAIKAAGNTAEGDWRKRYAAFVALQEKLIGRDQ
jgi:hypothetical protein